MRLAKETQVVETFQRTQGIELIHERSTDIFLQALEGVTDPEEKRKLLAKSSYGFSKRRKAESLTPIFSPRHFVPRCHRIGNK